MYEQIAGRRIACEFPARLGKSLLTQHELELVDHLAVLECSTSATRASGGKAGARCLPNCFPSASGDQKALIHTGDDESEGVGVVIDKAVLEAGW